MKNVRLIQYMRPYGTPVDTFTSVDDDLADLAEDMVLSCEVLTTGEVVIYGRRSSWTDGAALGEIAMTATNHPGPRQPDKVVAWVIRAVADRMIEERAKS